MAKLSIRDIETLQERMTVASKYMQENASGENNIIFYGLNKAGIGSLINYLLKNTLIGAFGLNKVILKKADTCFGPEIGNSISSEIKIPQKWTCDHLGNLSLWEMPAVEDGDPIQKITTTVYNHRLIENIDSLRIVLVVDFNDISSDNVRQFTTLLSKIETLLGKKMRNCFNSIAVVFTKVPKTTLTGNLIDFAFVTKILESKFLLSRGNIDFSETLRDFLLHLTRNNQNFGLFRVPEVGVVDHGTIGEGICEAIGNIVPASKNIVSQVSGECLLFLHHVEEILFPAKTFEKLVDAFEKYYATKRSYVLSFNNPTSESIRELERIKQELDSPQRRINEAMVNSKSINGIVSLQQVDEKISFVIETERLLEKYKLMEFINKELNLRELVWFDPQFEAVLTNARMTINNLIETTELQLRHVRKETKKREDEEVASREKEKRKQEEERRKNEKHNQELKRLKDEERRKDEEHRKQLEKSKLEEVRKEKERKNQLGILREYGNTCNRMNPSVSRFFNPTHDSDGFFGTKPDSSQEYLHNEDPELGANIPNENNFFSVVKSKSKAASIWLLINLAFVYNRTPKIPLLVVIMFGMIFWFAS